MKCPFCDSDPILQVKSLSETVSIYWIECPFCFLRCEVYKDPHMVKDSWERRSNHFSRLLKSKEIVLDKSLTPYYAAKLREDIFNEVIEEYFREDVYGD